jgi:hypothetical protein
VSSTSHASSAKEEAERLSVELEQVCVCVCVQASDCIRTCPIFV